jgi:hypothetical protein
LEWLGVIDEAPECKTPWDDIARPASGDEQVKQ